MQHLTPNTLLKGGEYKIEKVLGQGGFGITYLAEQVNLKRKVAIKEFFMKELCNRDETTSHVSVGSVGSIELVERFKTKFLKEARNIAKLNHSSIVRVIDVFEENGTAYYVMEYLEGGSLGEMIKSKGALSETEALRYIRQVGKALTYIHQQNINHLDIKPANIMLNSQNEAVLIDFGMSKQYDTTTGSQTSTTPIGISEGYAPIEQYQKGGVSTFSPLTDIYALGATLYKLVTGFTPPNASEVLNKKGLPPFPSNVSASTAEAIKKAMQPSRDDRPQSIGEFLEILKVGTSSENTDQTKKEETKSIDDSNELYRKADELYEKKDYANAVPLFEKAANLGNASAQNSLGNCYYWGNGVTKDYAKAVEWYTKAAKQGNAWAQRNLGNCYYSGKGVPKDYVKAVEWYTKAANQGHAWGQYHLGSCYYDGKGVAQDYEKAKEWYTKAAEQGFVMAKNKLEKFDKADQTTTKVEKKDEPTNTTKPEKSFYGYLGCLVYIIGFVLLILFLEFVGCPISDFLRTSGQDLQSNGNMKTGKTLIHTAAILGNDGAIFDMGRIYDEGLGVDQDYTKAVEWYRKAAEQGDAKAQYNLGLFYYNGMGVPQSTTEAIKWYTKAAEQGYAMAQTYFGFCYEYGQGVTQDYSKAVEWYRKAAEQGDAEAQHNLGNCYFYGNGVTKDYSKAVEWYRKAAEQGDVSAQCHLGECYEHGQGVTQDYSKAVEWYRKAAEQGNSIAQEALSRLGEK